MTAVLGPPAPSSLSEVSFEIGYVSEDGAEHRVPLEEAWQVPLEVGRPARRFPALKGQRHLSGLSWSATMRGHVGYESWLERDHLLALDYDVTVATIASQPFWLSWSDDAGQVVRHAPNFLARRADGSAVDCRPAERRPPRDVAKFEATATACEALAWEYRLVAGRVPVSTALGARDRCGAVGGRDRVDAVDDRGREGRRPARMLPVMFHLLWCQELVVDLRARCTTAPRCGSGTVAVAVNLARAAAR